MTTAGSASDVFQKSRFLVPAKRIEAYLGKRWLIKSVQPPASSPYCTHEHGSVGRIRFYYKGILSCVVRAVAKPAKIGDNFTS